jgi:rifampicin phosphotransferase
VKGSACYDGRMIAGLLALREVSGHPLDEVGGKAAALGQLMAYGATVPAGFVISPTLTLSSHTHHILGAFDELGVQYVAVRSSAAREDGQGQSWAGQFESYLNVPRTELLDRIRDCRNSGASKRAQAYDTTHTSMPVAAIVQVMVPSEAAGVLFTVNPVTKNHNQIMVEAVNGLGEQLVSGMVTPDNYLLTKSGQILQQTLAPPSSDKPAGPILNPAQLTKLATIATQLESRFGYPLDIEWAYHRNQPYIVQARPITTL